MDRPNVSTYSSSASTGSHQPVSAGSVNASSGNSNNGNGNINYALYQGNYSTGSSLSVSGGPQSIYMVHTPPLQQQQQQQQLSSSALPQTQYSSAPAQGYGTTGYPTHGSFYQQTSMSAPSTAGSSSISTSAQLMRSALPSSQSHTPLQQQQSQQLQQQQQQQQQLSHGSYNVNSTMSQQATSLPPQQQQQQGVVNYAHLLPTGSNAQGMMMNPRSLPNNNNNNNNNNTTVNYGHNIHNGNTIHPSGAHGTTMVSGMGPAKVITSSSYAGSYSTQHHQQSQPQPQQHSQLTTTGSAKSVMPQSATPAPTPSSHRSQTQSHSTSQAPAPTLNWQVCEAIFYGGIGRAAHINVHLGDARVSISSEAMGCLMKTKDLSLVFTYPALAMLREQLLRSYWLLKSPLAAVPSSSSSSSTVTTTMGSCSSPEATSTSSPSTTSAGSNTTDSQQQQQLRKDCDLISQQRALRAMYSAEEVKQLLSQQSAAILAASSVTAPNASGSANHNAVSTAQTMTNAINPFHLLHSTISRYRTRKQTYKDIRQWDKEERSQREQKRKLKKGKQLEFLKAMMTHQEAFLKYHQDIRKEQGKTARAARMALESQVKVARREEFKAELQRLQALKANDMATYVQMLAHTKNDRLQFLISQTDSFLQSINQKIQTEREKSDTPAALSTSAASGSTQSDKKKGRGRKPSISTSEELAESEAESAAAVEASSSAQSATPSAVESTSKPTEDSEEGNPEMTAKLTQASRDYYRSTHRVNESVHQPRMLIGGQLKEYQLQGLQWMVSLHNNRLSGILADEMGLGKTIQTISLLCYLVEVKKKPGPFLCIVPLSTMSNWINEFAKWAPELLIVDYKGSKYVRRDLRRKMYSTTSTSSAVAAGEGVTSSEVLGSTTTTTSMPPSASAGARHMPSFHVLLTTYEYAIRDKSQLKRFPWEYIIVDEGHRVKNADSLLSRTLAAQYHSKFRLLLTGTPLQNNLPELWALLNFLLPTIFSSAESFEEWFSKPFEKFRQRGAMSERDPMHDRNAENTRLTQEEQLLVVQRLHEVLRPFVLRRVKRDVQDQLPEKTERVLRVPLSHWQRHLYNLLLTKGFAQREDSQAGNNALTASSTTPATSTGIGGLSNTIMQLRKVCNHPYLFLKEFIMDDFLVRASGKFLLLDRMLIKLKAAGHRVLIFSQMVETLKLLEDFLQMRTYSFLTLHGSISAEEREQRIYQFNADDSPFFCFLLSTRAGGLGVNLASADTVIIFDSDWNPMADAQAQDRAHRIGQKNKVSVYILQTNTSVEEKILQTANEKKSLTGLVVDAADFDIQGHTAGGGASSSTSQQQSQSQQQQQQRGQNRELLEMLLNELKGNAEKEREAHFQYHQQRRLPLVSSADDIASGNAALDAEDSAVGVSGGLRDEPTGNSHNASSTKDVDECNDEELNALLATADGEEELYQSIDAIERQRRCEERKRQLSRVSSTEASVEDERTFNARVASQSHRLTLATDERDMPLWLSSACFLPRYESLWTATENERAVEEEIEREIAQLDADAGVRRSAARDEGEDEDEDMDEEVNDDDDDGDEGEDEEVSYRSHRKKPLSVTLHSNKRTLSASKTLKKKSKSTIGLGESDVEDDTDVRRDYQLSATKPNRSKVTIDPTTLTIRLTSKANTSLSTPLKATPPVTVALTKSAQKRSRKSLTASPPAPSVPLSATDGPSLTQTLYSIVQAINKLEIAVLFHECPSPKLYPQYSHYVSHPISLKEISQQLKAKTTTTTKSTTKTKTGGLPCYSYFEEIELAFALMSHNARCFNGQESIVFTLAEQVRQEWYTRTLPVRKRFGCETLYEMRSQSTAANSASGGVAVMPVLPADSYEIYSDKDRAMFVGVLNASLLDENREEEEESPMLVLPLSHKKSRR